MNLTDCLNEAHLGLRRTFLKVRLLGLITGFIVFFPTLHAICPTACTKVSDFCCVQKGFNVRPIIVDDFEDDETPFGIVSKEPIVTKSLEDEGREIMEEDPAELEYINAGELLSELQKEGDIYLGINYGIGPRISMEEAIYLALKDNEGVGFGNTSVNEGITTAYLNREVQIEALKVAENDYRLQWFTDIGINFARTNFRDAPHSTTVTLPSPGITTALKLKTGGKIDMKWTNSYSYTKVSGRPSDTTATTNLAFTLTQPLLKGAGFTIGTLPLTKAYLTEESNVNTLKSTVMDVVTQTIRAYRAYKVAIDQFEIDKRSIEEARRDLEKTKLLVEAGIRAESDIVEGQYSLATREFSFQDSQNTVDQARIAFLRVMNMDTSLRLVPDNLYIVDLDPKDLPSVEELVAIAWLNDPNYLNQLITLRVAELDYFVARNGVLWQLDYTAGISAGATRSSLGRSNQNSWDFRDRTVQTGLVLSIPFNNLTSEQNLISQKIGLRIARINVQKAEQDKISAVKNQLRTIKKNIIQLKLSKISLLLAKQRLVQKRIQIEAGSSSSFELTSILDQYISGETEVLNSEVNLMNSLTDMDLLLGTTLDTWNIDVNRRTDNVPKLSDTLLGKLKVEQ